MATKRESPPPALAAQVALAAVRGDRPVNERAAPSGVRPTLIRAWKKQLTAGAEQVFAGGKVADPAEGKTPELFERIGRLKVGLDRVGKKAAAIG